MRRQAVVGHLFPCRIASWRLVSVFESVGDWGKRGDAVNGVSLLFRAEMDFVAPEPGTPPDSIQWHLLTVRDLSVAVIRYCGVNTESHLRLRHRVLSQYLHHKKTDTPCTLLRGVVRFQVRRIPQRKFNNLLF